jgi:hypothetical protein
MSYWFFSYRVYTQCYYNGFARFTKEELYEIAKKDLRSLNDLIGNKKFLFSDTKPCDVDFSIFGVCSQIKYNDLGPLNQFLNGNLYLI